MHFLYRVKPQLTILSDAIGYFLVTVEREFVETIVLAADRCENGIKDEAPCSRDCNTTFAAHLHANVFTSKLMSRRTRPICESMKWADPSISYKPSVNLERCNDDTEWLKDNNNTRKITDSDVFVKTMNFNGYDVTDCLDGRVHEMRLCTMQSYRGSSKESWNPT